MQPHYSSICLGEASYLGREQEQSLSMIEGPDGTVAKTKMDQHSNYREKDHTMYDIRYWQNGRRKAFQILKFQEFRSLFHRMCE